MWISAGIAQLFCSLCLKFTHRQSSPELFSSSLWGLLFLFSILVVLFANNNGLYRQIWQRRLDEEIKFLGESVASASVVLAASVFLETLHIGSAFIAGVTIITSWLMLVGWRRFLHIQAIPGLTEKRNVLIVGGGRTARALQAHFDQNPEFGYVVKGLIDRRGEPRPGAPATKEHSAPFSWQSVRTS